MSLEENKPYAEDYDGMHGLLIDTHQADGAPESFSLRAVVASTVAIGASLGVGAVALLHGPSVMAREFPTMYTEEGMACLVDGRKNIQIIDMSGEEDVIIGRTYGGALTSQSGAFMRGELLDPRAVSASEVFRQMEGDLPQQLSEAFALTMSLGPVVVDLEKGVCHAPAVSEQPFERLTVR